MLLYWGKIIWKTKRTYCKKDGSEMKLGGTIQKQWLYLKGLFNPKVWTLMGKQARYLPLFSIFFFPAIPSRDKWYGIQIDSDSHFFLISQGWGGVVVFLKNCFYNGNYMYSNNDAWLNTGDIKSTADKPQKRCAPHLKLIFLSESKPPGHFKLFHNLDF